MLPYTCTAPDLFLAWVTFAEYKSARCNLSISRVVINLGAYKIHGGERSGPEVSWQSSGLRFHAPR
jgi:hypothetical protein